MVSVIVPVYNTECYLPACIKSIQGQSYDDWELILVDDGSTDTSMEICRKFADKDDRILVLHQENKGVTAARKLGVEHSHGEFLCFVDSDDMMYKNALTVLMAKMTENVDIVITWENKEEVISGDEYVERLLQKKTALALWGKLYRRDLVLSSRALDIGRNIYIGEDHLANIKMALLASNVVCLTDAVYVYRDNMQSVWHTRNWSLEYEEMFRDEVRIVLGDRIGDFEESWYKFQLYILYDLVRHGVRFSYKRPWISLLLSDRHEFSLSMREKIVKNIHNRLLCRIALMLGFKIKNILKRSS